MSSHLHPFADLSLMLIEKLDDILRTIDTVLSSPPLPPAILEKCKIFLFTTTSPPPGRLQPTKGAPKERVVSVVVSQPIKWAMRVLTPNEKGSGGNVVDSGEGVLCECVLLIHDRHELMIDQHPSLRHWGSIGYLLFPPIGPSVLLSSYWMPLVNIPFPVLDMIPEREKLHSHNRQIVGGLLWRNGAKGRLGFLLTTSRSSRQWALNRWHCAPY
jgi:hypothetical protein